MGPLIGGDTCNQVGPPIGGEISNWRWALQSEVGPLIGGEISNWRCQGCIGGVSGIFGVGKECRNSGARRGIGSFQECKGHQGPLGSVLGCQGCIGDWQGV